MCANVVQNQPKPAKNSAHNPKVGGSNPPPATTYKLPGPHWLPLATALGTAQATTRITGQYAANYHIVGGRFAEPIGVGLTFSGGPGGGGTLAANQDYDMQSHQTEATYAQDQANLSSRRATYQRRAGD
jgi:hypothetical protein